jgi:PEGA domain
LALAVLPSGCVRRRLAVRSNPPGALVFVDNQQIGSTPCSVDFTYYGTREIRLVKPGFETLTVNQPIPTPWYQLPPLDFVSENLMPNKIQDHRTVAFNLEPQLIVPTEQLLDRANQLRQETQQGIPAPSTAIQATPTPVVQAEPMPSYVVPPGPTPTPLPPVTQTAPPGMYFQPATDPNSPYAPPTFTPGAAAPVPAPFAPPALPAAPPGGTQVGPPLVSPPLR